MTAWLGAQGHAINRKRVARLMRLMGLEAIYQRPRAKQSAAVHRVFPYPPRGLSIGRVNRVWAAEDGRCPPRSR